MGGSFGEVAYRLLVYGYTETKAHKEFYDSGFR